MELRYEFRLVAINAEGTEKTVDTFDLSAPKPSQSGKLNMHAGGKVTIGGDRWQVGANVTKISAQA